MPGKPPREGLPDTGFSGIPGWLRIFIFVAVCATGGIGGAMIAGKVIPTMKPILLAFVLLHNTPTGQDEVMRLVVPEEQCLRMEKQVWAIDWPVVAYPQGMQALGEDGKPEEIPVTDAACLPLGQGHITKGPVQ
jgi:hypothetical protein